MVVASVGNACVAVGADRVGTMTQVAPHANFKILQRAPVGATVRIGGRFVGATTGVSRKLTTTDGGELNVVGEPGDDLASVEGFVEVWGTKEESGALCAIAVMTLGEEVDVELWDEAVKMTYLPGLRAMFEAAPVAA